MKIKFVLKAKDLNKKWLKSVKSLYGKQKLVISIEPDNGEEMDFDFDDDSWWNNEDEEFALEIDNEVEGNFNAEEYLASLENQWVESAEPKPEAEAAETPVKKERKKTERKPKEVIVETPVKPKGKGGRPPKKVNLPVAENPLTETEVVVETPVKPKGKGGRPPKKVNPPVAEIPLIETEVVENNEN